MTPAAPSPSRWSRLAHEVLGLDLRSLAVMRILLGLLMMIDVLGRFTDIPHFYTDISKIPRTAVLEHLGRDQQVSAFLMGGTPGFVAVLFAVMLVFAASYTVGYRTRLTGAVAWFLLISLQTRAPIVLQSGDVVLRLMVFWSLFLPIEGRLSIDSLRALPTRAAPRSVLSVAAFALAWQLNFVYIFTWILKSGKAWRDGTAVYYALSIDHFAKQPVASWLLASQPVWEFLTHATFIFEIVGPFLLLVPFWRGPVRTATVLAFVGLHLGFHFGLAIGLFPFICIAAWIGLLPGWFWDRAGWRTAEGPPRRAAWWNEASALLFFGIALWWNLSTLEGLHTSVPAPMRTVGHLLRLDQKWNMFAPYPLKDDGWFRMPGKLVNGTEVDLWTGEEPDWATAEERAGWTKEKEAPNPEQAEAYRLSRRKPTLASAEFKNQRWQKYMRNIWSKEYKSMRVYLGKDICRKWNDSHAGAEKLRSFKIVYMKETTPPPGGTTEVVPVQIWSHDCFKREGTDSVVTTSPATGAKTKPMGAPPPGSKSTIRGSDAGPPPASAGAPAVPAEAGPGSID
jgi:hypothetical protein